MQYFIGITLPAYLGRKVVSFQNSFPTNVVQYIAEPHITVKAQAGLTPDESWVESVKDAVKTFRSFEVNLGGVGSFGDTVLFLNPAPLNELIRLHKLILEVVSPTNESIQKYFEGDAYLPHVTLGGTSWGMTRDDLVLMEEQARKQFNDPESFVVNFVRVFRQQDENVSYEKLIDLPLG